MLSQFSHVQLFATLWTVAHQVPLSMGFPRQECWSGLPCPSLGDLPNPGIKLLSLTSPALAGGFFATCTTFPLNPLQSPWHPLATLSVYVLICCLSSRELSSGEPGPRLAWSPRVSARHTGHGQQWAFSKYRVNEWDEHRDVKWCQGLSGNSSILLTSRANAVYAAHLQNTVICSKEDSLKVTG